jgi:hypothetical protein
VSTGGITVQANSTEQLNSILSNARGSVRVIVTCSEIGAVTATVNGATTVTLYADEAVNFRGPVAVTFTNPLGKLYMRLNGAPFDGAAIVTGSITTGQIYVDRLVSDTDVTLSANVTYHYKQGAGTVIGGRQDPWTGGETGGTVSVKVGTVTALPADAVPTVENVGTDTEVILNFGIPVASGSTGGSTNAEDIKISNAAQFFAGYSVQDAIQVLAAGIPVWGENEILEWGNDGNSYFVWDS